jgi:hypothetical protein
MSTHKGTAIVARLILEDILVVPNLLYNLVSVGKVQDKRMNMSLEKVSGNSKEAGIKRIGNFFKLEEAYSKEENIMEIHKRYGHTSFCTLKSLYSHLVPASLPQYDACIKGKTRKPSSLASDRIRTNRPGQLIHSDICRPMPTTSSQVYKYFITFINDYFQFGMIKVITKKFDAAHAVLDMINVVQNLYSSQVS